MALPTDFRAKALAHIRAQYGLLSAMDCSIVGIEGHTPMARLPEITERLCDILDRQGYMTLTDIDSLATELLVPRALVMLVTSSLSAGKDKGLIEMILVGRSGKRVSERVRGLAIRFHRTVGRMVFVRWVPVTSTSL